ncbi:MAG: cytochrome P450, partial [Acidimicrobiia bacterium]|nr:cytochrome P450 [Acidimicrobiia bacterium]
KENEAFMWRLADDQIATFVAGGSCEYMNDFAQPFALLVIADLLGVPEADRATFTEALLHRPADHGVGSGEQAMAKNPLEFLYEQFTAYVEDRRANPTDDVLTGLAQATFPDGSTPEVIDVVRVASNLFAAGQETTVRLLCTALKVLGEDHELQDRVRADRTLIPNFIEEALRYESPVKGDFRLSRVPTSVGGVDMGAGTTVMVVNGAGNRDPRRFPDPDTFDIERENARQHLAFGRGIHTCPGAPLARSEARIAIERILDHTADIGIAEEHHGPPGDRRYDYVPTFILRGLTRLHLEFTPVEPPSAGGT